MKRLLATVLLAIAACCAFNAHAVLKERNLGKTLEVLCAELEQNYNQQQRMIKIYEQRTLSQHQQLVKTMKQIDQISLILYSQRTDFTFDMAYACQEATNLYRNSNLTHLPYSYIHRALNDEIVRYDSLINVLKNIAPAISDEPKDKPKIEEVKAKRKALVEKFDADTATTAADSTAAAMAVAVLDSLIQEMDEASKQKTRDLFMLNDEEQRLRARCLHYANEIRANLQKVAENIEKDQHYYDVVTKRLEAINNYALKRYEELRKGIFENGGRNYFQVLMSLPMLIRTSKAEASVKYETLETGKDRKIVHSDWRGPVIVGTSLFILFYLIIAALLTLVVRKWLLPRRFKENETYKSKSLIIGVLFAVFIFTIAITIERSYVYNNFIYMASGITIDFAWLVMAILLSLVIRLKGAQLRAGALAYTPFMAMAFIVIVFRIIFIPNDLVNLIYPPLLLIFTIWQLRTVKNPRMKLLPQTDIIFSSISLLAMIASCILAWAGYTLLAVQIMVWWSFQLACVQTIICLYDLAKMYEERYVLKKLNRNKNALSENEKKTLLQKARNGDFINKTWMYDLFLRAVLPVLGVLSLLMSVVMAANLFDMKEIFVKAFYYLFVDKTGMVQLSLYKIVLVGSMFFIFSFINYMGHCFYRFVKLKKAKKNPNYRANLTLANNIISIAVWGIYFIFALFVFQVPKSGISLISAGLATGLGFAMKDILENFIYGLSLMSGRVRVGDYIECDGILGKVESIGYQSTQIITLDGSVIAFLNTSLFNKNFKNLTRNHSYEYVKVPIGVAYGTNVNQVRELLTRELEKLVEVKNGRPIIQKKQGFQVVFNDFGDNAIELFVNFWVLVEEKIGFVYRVKETIYNVLQENNIEIPFPQRDIYVRQLPTNEQQS